MGETFEEEDEELQRLIASIGHSNPMSSSKSMNASWIGYFDEGEGSCSELVLEALLA